jgi:chaperonin cofactor prefoldin
MAAKGQSLAEKLSRWAVTASNLKEHLEEMPHVAPDLEAMDKAISEARALESQLEDIRGRAREVSAKLQALAKDGEKLRSRLRSHLQAKFGPTSESLVKFGFRPRRTPSRTQAPETPGPEGPGPVVTKPVAQP